MIQLFLLLISFCVFKNLVCMESSKLKDENQFFPNSIIPFVKGGCRMFKGRNQDCFLSEPAALAVNDWINKNPQHVINYAKNHDLEVLSEKTVNELELLRQSFEEQKKIQLKCDTLKNELEEKEKLILELNRNFDKCKEQEKVVSGLMQELTVTKSKLLEDAQKLKVIQESHQSENLILKGQNKDLLALNKEINSLNNQLIERVKILNEKLKQFSKTVQFEPINKVLDNVRNNLVQGKEQDNVRNNLVQGKEQLKTRNKSMSVQSNPKESEQKRAKTVSVPSDLKQNQVKLLNQSVIIKHLSNKIKELNLQLNVLSNISFLDKQHIAKLVSDLQDLNGKYRLLNEQYQKVRDTLENNEVLLLDLKKNIIQKQNNYSDTLGVATTLKKRQSEQISSLKKDQTSLEESVKKQRKVFLGSIILNGFLILGISLFSCRNLIKNGFCKIWELRHAIPSNIIFSGFSNPFANSSIGSQIALRWALLRNYIGI